jgi:hypothetical protein
MIALPKLILIILVAGLVWYAMRWLNRAPPPKAVRRRDAPSRSQAAVEDLTQCKTCGAYVAASAHACGKAGCPLLP